jgi:hypothetical protein
MSHICDMKKIREKKPKSEEPMLKELWDFGN